MNFVNYIRRVLSWKTAFLVLLWCALGIILMILGYFHSATHPFASFLEEQTGGLCIFGAAIPVVSDFLVKRDFEALIQRTMDRAGLDDSIQAFGLSEVIPIFSSQRLWVRFREASLITMLVLRSSTFFEEHYEEIVQDLSQRGATLRLLLPNPENQALMRLMAAKFSDLETAAAMAQSLEAVVRTWLKANIYDRLPAACRGRLQVRLYDKYPLYSAYEFDHSELWYIPYHHRNNRRPIPTFVFRGDFSQNQVHLDLGSLWDESLPLDLSAL